MTRTVQFDRVVAAYRGRPWAVVVLHGPGGSHGTRWKVAALMDTGADDLHLPEEAARRVGLAPQTGQSVRLASAGGQITRHRLQVDVDVQGTRVKLDALFAPGAMPLVGRRAMFSVMEAAGFTSGEWLVKWPPPPPPATSSSQDATADQSGPRPAATPSSRAHRITVDDDWIVIGGVRIQRRPRLRPRPSPRTPLDDASLVVDGLMSPDEFDQRHGAGAWEALRRSR
jgi:hypothetical protein